MMKWNRIQIYCALLMTGMICVVAQAASISGSDIPDGSNWYVHVNLDLIQTSDVGRSLMLESVNEALGEIEEELDVDIQKEIDGITLFGKKLPEHGSQGNDVAVILHGAIGLASQSALLSSLEQKGAQVSALDSAGFNYYSIAGGDGTMTYTDEDGQQREVDWGHRETLYFSFGAKQTLVTPNLEIMQAFLDGGGYLGGYELVDPGALLVLQADRALLQGGANTSIEIGADWDSSVLKNVDAVAMVIAEDNGGLFLNAQLMANSADVAMSVRNIVEGLVALKALDQTEGVFGDILRQVRFESNGSVLNMYVPVAADQIEALRDHL